MALQADELWTIHGKSGAVHVVSDESFLDVNALQRKVFSGGQNLHHRQTLHMVLLSVGTTVAGVMSQLSVELPVLIWETNKLRGLSEHDSRRFDVK